MERELTDLKASLVNMVENTGTVRNFSDVVKSPSQVSHAQLLQRVVSDCSAIDEGYGRSATQPKTLLVPDYQVRDHRSSTSTVPQPGQIQNFQAESQPVSAGQSVEHSRESFLRHNLFLFISRIGIYKIVKLRTVESRVSFRTEMRSREPNQPEILIHEIQIGLRIKEHFWLETLYSSRSTLEE